MPYTSRSRQKHNHQKRDFDQSLQSIASSTGSNHGTISTDSTMTTFDPVKDEAIMSTRQMDDLSRGETHLPQIRDTARKVGRWGPKPPEFLINTSAIGRAFPDFTQGESSDDSMSFEIARGPKTQRNPSNGKIEPLTEYSDSVASSPVIFHEDFHLITTPKRGQPKESILKDALRNSAAKITPRSDSRKENIPPADSQHSTPVRGSPYVSHASRTISNERKTLAELHARVSEDCDTSLLGADRPVTVTLPAKNTRFSASTTKSRKSVHESDKSQVHSHATEKIRANSASTRAQTSITINSTPTNPNTQSFILPNVPEVSLNAGTLVNSVPVVVRGGTVQSQSISGNIRRYPHEPVDGIIVPDEEEDIYLSLQLMKARVAKLEQEKKDDKEKFVNLGVELQLLKAEKQEREKRSTHSAMGTGEDGFESDADDAQYLGAIAKLSAHAASVTEDLATSGFKITDLESRVESLTAERDRGLKELTSADRRIETLERRNRELEEVNRSIREELRQFLDLAEDDNRGNQDLRENLTKRLAIVTTQAEVLKAKLAALDQNNKVLDDQNRLLRRQSDEHLSLAKEECTHTGRILTEVQEMRARERQHKKAMTLQTRMVRENAENVKIINDLHKTRTQSLKSRHGQKDRVRPTADQAQRKYEKLKSTASTCQQGGITRSDTVLSNRIGINEHLQDETFDADTSGDTTIHRDLGVPNLEGDSLELSDIASDDMSDVSYVRRELRESRKLMNEMLVKKPADEDITECSSFSVQAAPSEHTVAGLSGILKNKRTELVEDFTGRVSIKSAKSHHIEEELANMSGMSLSRRHSEPGGRRGARQEYEDMTSEFIIPDIISNGQKDEARPALSSCARQVLDNLCAHDQKNCTICARIASVKTKIDTKQKIHITRPVPVSDRMPVVAPYEEEPTLRPSVAPGLALATVMKGLQDEIDHLRTDHSRVHAAYIRYDASMGKKQRRSLKLHLEKTIISIDRKMDQIYALYDVLEGQKASGQSMTEEDIEITLQGLGIVV